MALTWEWYNDFNDYARENYGDSTNIYSAFDKSQLSIVKRYFKVRGRKLFKESEIKNVQFISRETDDIYEFSGILDLGDKYDKQNRFMISFRNTADRASRMGDNGSEDEPEITCTIKRIPSLFNMSYILKHGIDILEKINQLADRVLSEIKLVSYIMDSEQLDKYREDNYKNIKVNLLGDSEEEELIKKFLEYDIPLTEYLIGIAEAKENRLEIKSKLERLNADKQTTELLSLYLDYDAYLVTRVMEYVILERPLKKFKMSSLLGICGYIVRLKDRLDRDGIDIPALCKLSKRKVYTITEKKGIRIATEKELREGAVNLSETYCYALDNTKYKYVNTINFLFYGNNQSLEEIMDKRDEKGEEEETLSIEDIISGIVPIMQPTLEWANSEEFYSDVDRIIYYGMLPDDVFYKESGTASNGSSSLSEENSWEYGIDTEEAEISIEEVARSLMEQFPTNLESWHSKVVKSILFQLKNKPHISLSPKQTRVLRLAYIKRGQKPKKPKDKVLLEYMKKCKALLKEKEAGNINEGVFVFRIIHTLECNNYASISIKQANIIDEAYNKWCK